MPLSPPVSGLREALAALAARPHDRDDLGRAAVAAVHAALPQANWTGIYWLEGDALVLGPYLGAPTEHARIAVGEGVCGTAVAEDRDQVVPDVRARPNYLACSLRTRSEIVVLVRRRGGAIVGQIDIDSDSVGAFSPSDHAFLTEIASALGGWLPR